MFTLSPTTRRSLLVSGAAIILSVAAIGVAGAQQTPAPGPSAPGQTTPARSGHTAFLEALARRLGITTDRLQQAITESRNEVGLPNREEKPGFGRFGHRFGRGGLDASVAAQAIGITVDQLRQELPGKSLAQVAEAHGKNPADVATALKDAVNQHIDQAVAAGRLTADQSAQLKQQKAQRIDQIMNRVLPQGGWAFRGHAPVSRAGV
jgi:hypothetical protein